MCIRCQTGEVPEPLGLCPGCALHVRLECSAGLRRLGLYLAAWAAFDDWLQHQGAKPA